MKLFTYNLLIFFFLPFYIFRILFKSIKDPDYILNFIQRFGIYKKAKTSSSIWFHAVSLGEVISSEKIIKKLLISNEITLSVSTPTGLRHAKKLYGNEIDIVYLPYDFWFFVNGFFATFNPKALIIYETEIWPSMIMLSKKNKIPVILCNGRLSNKSSKRYLRFKNFFKFIFSNIDLLLVQDQSHKNNFVKIIGNDSSIKITGSIKFDIDSPDFLNKDIKRYFYFLASSTHEGEEAVIIKVFLKLRQKFNSLNLVLAPRHPERYNSISKILDEYKLNYIITSNVHETLDSKKIVLFNGIGKLDSLYKHANFAFVGGSMFPQYGGHNIIEPAINNCPFIIGPYMNNFKEIAKIFIETESCIQISSNINNSLYDASTKILEDETFAKKITQNAIATVNKNKGSLNHQYNEILKLVNQG